MLSLTKSNLKGVKLPSHFINSFPSEPTGTIKLENQSKGYNMLMDISRQNNLSDFLRPPCPA